MQAIVLSTLVLATQGVKLKTPPSIPKELQWAMVVDGKDADLGPNGYDGVVLKIPGFEDTLEHGLPLALQQVGPFTEEAALAIRQECCGSIGFRNEQTYLPLDGKWTACFLGMSCKAQEAALSDVPKYLNHVTKKKHQPGCLDDIHNLVTGNNTAHYLTALLQDYAKDATSLLEQGASFEAKLDRLARMLRHLAWLHPYRDMNGRFRTLLLQREVRNLGLGSGVSMFNNNRDVYYIALDTYKQKIIEGIHMLDLTVKTGTNAWLDTAKVQAHMDTFPRTVTRDCKNHGGQGAVMRSGAEQSDESLD